ncbi:hydrogenase maturation protease [bacterium]|nr:MAG: hydrogenase maturation protease [bacterium]
MPRATSSRRFRVASSLFHLLADDLRSPDRGSEGLTPPSVLILGYGNPDRQDDGVGYQALIRLASALGRPLPGDAYESLIPVGRNPDLWFDLQLKPEMAEEIARYDQVFFIDAHTGALPEEIGWRDLSPQFQTSPLTHHLTPESCLSLTESLYGKKPAAILVSIRGFEFGFSSTLSQRTEELLEKAVARVLAWLNNHLIP